MPMVTLNHCLICYHPVGPSASWPGSGLNIPSCVRVHNTKNKNSEICRRFGTIVSRYLDLDPYHFSPCHTLMSKMTVNYASVCDLCLPQVESFCQIFDMMEYMKLQINWKLQEIGDVMKIADDKNEKQFAFYRKSLEEKLAKNEMTTEDIDDFRKEFCDEVALLKRGFPYVRLKTTNGTKEKSQSLMNDVYEGGDPDFTPVLLKPSDNENSQLQTTSKSREVNKCTKDACVETHELETASANVVKGPCTDDPVTISATDLERKKRFQCPAPACNKKFISLYTMSIHIQSVHLKQRQVPCTLCPRRFFSNLNLSMHMRNVHNQKLNFTTSLKNNSRSKNSPAKRGRPKQPAYVCLLCSKIFSKKEYLTTHQRRVHSPLKCKFCYKGFTQKYYLTKHEQNHSGENPNGCRLCGRGFKSTFSLNEHMIYKHQNKVGLQIARKSTSRFQRTSNTLKDMPALPSSTKSNHQQKPEVSEYPCTPTPPSVEMDEPENEIGDGESDVSVLIIGETVNVPTAYYKFSDFENENINSGYESPESETPLVITNVQSLQPPNEAI